MFIFATAKLHFFFLLTKFYSVFLCQYHKFGVMYVAGILENGVSIWKNGVSILENGVSILENGVSILENGVSILGNGVSIPTVQIEWRYTRARGFFWCYSRYIDP